MSALEGAGAKLVVDHVSKEFATRRGPVLALEDVCLEVREGEHVSIVGPTGCGKTTLLNLIAGFEAPTRGSIRIGGRPVAGPGPDRGVIFQQANVFPWLTVRDNVLFAARFGRREDGEPLGGGDAGALERAAEELIRQVGLAGCEQLYPYQISGGMKARAALARVLLMGSPMLLLDEPFVALDAQTRGSMHRLLMRLMKGGGGKSLVIITHDVDEAVLLADTVYVMSRRPGRIVDRVDVPFGFPREYSAISRDPAFVACRVEVLDRLEPLIGGE
jgi:NitT/TauT family transport system ATP-binding protein